MVSQLELTVKEFAAKERVTERTVWGWIRKGAVTIRRTPGRGVRILTIQESASEQLKNTEKG